MPSSLKDWIGIVSVTGGLVFAVGAWTGRYNERVEALLSAQDSQMRTLQTVVSSQSIQIAVMQEQVRNLKDQVDAVSKAVGAPIIR